MNEAEQKIEQEAVRWIRRHTNKGLIFDKFASLNKYSTSARPLVIFAAGSPGAGKTEFIKDFRKSIDKIQGTKSVCIDPDAIREFLPGYAGSNSYLFQRAVSIAVDDLFRLVLKNRQSTFMDGTLSDYNRAYQNISRVLDQYSTVMILYVFQHPKIAWHFTQLREVVEGRNIQKKDFIDKFIGAKETVDKLKSHFGDRVNLNVILKDYKDTKENKAVEKVFHNVSSVEDCLTFDYTNDSIKRILL